MFIRLFGSITRHIHTNRLWYVIHFLSVHSLLQKEDVFLFMFRFCSVPCFVEFTIFSFPIRQSTYVFSILFFLSFSQITFVLCWILRHFYFCFIFLLDVKTRDDFNNSQYFGDKNRVVKRETFISFKRKVIGCFFLLSILRFSCLQTNMNMRKLYFMKSFERTTLAL